MLTILTIILTACRATPGEKEVKFLKQGKELLAKNDFERATLQFQNAARVMPTDAEPFYQLGVAFLGKGDALNAFRAFQKAIQLDPGHKGAQLKIAQFVGTTQDAKLIRDSVTQLTGVFGSDPSDPEVVNQLALDEWKLGDPEKAAQRLEETLKKFPGNLQSSVTLARMKLTARDWKGADEILQQAVAAAPQSAPAATALGQFHAFMNEPQKAEAELQRAIQLDPGNAAALISLAAVQMATNRPEAADQTYRLIAALPGKPYRAVHAVFLYQTGKREAALLEFEKLAEKDPDDRDTRAQLVAAYMALAMPEKAEGVIAAALHRNPNDTTALIQRAELHLRNKKADDAGKDLSKVITYTPDSARAHFLMAGVHRLKHQDGNERTELQRALELAPELLEARRMLAMRYLSLNEPKLALALIDQAPEDQKRDLQWLISSTWALLASSKLDQAQANIERAMMFGRPPVVIFQSAVLQFAQKNFAEARRQLESLASGGHADMSVVDLLLKTYTEQNQPDKAMEKLKEVASANPHSAPLQQLLGQWYLKSGKSAAAQEAFEKAKAADPHYLLADLALAEGDLNAGRVEAARQRLNPAVAANPENVPALLMAARAAEQGGDRAAAIAEYRTVLNLDAANLVALNNLAYALALDDPDEALKFGQRALEIAPDNPNAQDTLGWIYYRKKLYTMAVRYLKSASTKDPTPQRQFHLGMAYVQSGDKLAGQRLVQSALLKEPKLAATEQGW